MAFHFSRAAELLSSTQYLLEFDSTVKFKLVRNSRCATLQVSTVGIPPFSYTTVDFEDEPERLHKVAATESQTVSWAVSAGFFASVLGCFSGSSPISLEVDDNLTCVLLYQQREDDAGVQVAQIGALHDLGPKLLVDHDVGKLYTIADLRNFRQAVRSVCAGDDERCDVFLQRVSATGCELVMQASTVTSSLQLSLDERCDVSKHLEGSARCADLLEFARLCSRMAKLADSTSLMLGVGPSGITLFRFEWHTDHGKRTANLYFCTA
ncbi:hypothetical protein NESM_000269600 [Novymonas esmeraldas]|uniref:Cell cycle checkpoint protein RAD1 n=1 Tax=Novymonas esmeraldas TaxID=1808958 RepID=A0AAW0F743_9TRYP